ncbi:hypothetical protein KVG29_05740 [Caldicoprobacter algeriensis]|uniref:hypothetical protein n=1 Tax=Caldicoprobacter algeriensis TaxID=699281 RepID=UPI00207A2BD4|nr:hypothetical protein [Caldicoprobacter algeriensis]MCM8900730.1 hypothetical protein [Caldicoprobacter algeriensis]
MDSEIKKVTFVYRQQQYGRIPKRCPPAFLGWYTVSSTGVSSKVILEGVIQNGSCYP